MNRLRIIGALLASTVAMTACNQAEKQAAPAANSTAPAPAPAPAAPTNTAAPAAPAAGGAPAAAVQGQAQQNFTVVNNTGFTVMTLNVSSSNENSWGPDILGANVIANGASAMVTFERGQSECIWDIRATYEDGDTSDMRGVNLCEVATVTLTP